MFQGVNTDTDIGWEVAEEFRTVLSKRDHLLMANLGIFVRRELFCWGFDTLKNVKYIIFDVPALMLSSSGLLKNQFELR